MPPRFPMPPAGRLRLLAGAALLTFAASAALAQSPRVRFDLAPEPLDRALGTLARQAGVQVVFSSALAQGRTSPAVRGEFTPREALERLLAGSNLVLHTQDARTFTVEAAPPAPVPSPEEAATLGEVKVTAGATRAGTTEGTRSYTTPSTRTATRLDLSMRETPQSTTVVTRQRMDDQGMTSIVDVVQYTPGLFLSGSDGVGRPGFKARGFSANVMYEGFTSEYSSYLPGSQANLALFDRVEVVRGATGIAQGAGSPSAAINLIHKRPTRSFQGSVSLSAGRWDDHGTVADLAGPLNATGTLRGRVVASWQDAKTFRDVEAHRHGLFYGVLEADLAPATRLTLGAHRQTDHTNHFWYDLPMSMYGEHLGLPRSTFAGNDWEYADNRVDTAFAVLEHGLGGGWNLRLASLQSWRDLDILGTALYRDVPADTAYYSVWGGDYDYRHANYDASVSGPFELFGRRHQAVVGTTYQRLRTTSYNKDWTPDRIDGVDIRTWNPRGTPAPVGRIASVTQDVTRQESVYAATQLTLADPLKLILGSRLDGYGYQDRDGTGSYRISRNVTRYAGLTFDLDAHHTLYGSYTDIFRPQTQKDVGGRILTPVVGKNHEVGVKGEYFDGELNASLALFRVDQDKLARAIDAQATLCPTFPATYCFEAAGLVRTEGVDVELQGALSPNWQVAVGYTYADTRYVRDADPALVGTRYEPHSSPKGQLKLSTMYRFAGGWSRWRVGAALTAQSRIYADGTTDGDGDPATPPTRWRSAQGGYAVADATVGWQPRPDLDLQLNVTNVFDRVYYRAIGRWAEWSSTDIYGEPRKLKLTAKYSF